jgi:MFS family permease
LNVKFARGKNTWKKRTPRGPLRHRNFQLLFAGQTVSALGDQVVPVALAFAVLDLTGSASDLGLVLAASLVPRLVLTLAGGVWSDRLPRQRLMFGADVVRGAAQALVAVDLISGTAQIWHLAVLAAVEGAAGAFFTPASAGLMPSLVEGDELQPANALVGLARRATAVVGPAVGGALVTTVGPGWAFALDAATFGVSAGSLAALRVPAIPHGPRASFFSDLAEGFGELRRHTWYWSNVISHCLWNAGMGVFLVLGPLVAARSLGGARDWSVILVAEAVGGVAGGALALRFRPRRPLVAANLALALLGLPLAGLAGPWPTAALAASAGVAIGGLAFMSAIWETTVQRHIPAHALSRVVAYDWLASLVVMPVSFALAGALAGAIGTSRVLAGTAVIVSASSIGILVVPSVRRLGAHDGGEVGGVPLGRPAGEAVH